MMSKMQSHMNFSLHNELTLSEQYSRCTLMSEMHSHVDLSEQLYFH